MSPIVKALAWKEWREQRPTLLVGLGLLVLLPALIRTVAMASGGGGASLPGTMDMIPLLLTALMWPLFAAVIGATASGEGSERASLPFLLSRPASRRLLWTVKLVVGAASLLLLIAASSVAAQIHHFLILGRLFAFPFPSNLVTTISIDSARVLALGGVALCFAAAVFLGLFIRQQLTVAVAAMTMAAFACAGSVRLAGLFSAHRSLQRSGAEPFLAGYAVFLTIAVLGGSYRVFRVGGLMQKADLWRAARVVVPAMMIISGLGAAVSVSATTRPRIDHASLFDAVAVPGRQAVLIQAGQNDFVGEAFFVVEPGSEPTRLTRRLVSDGLPSPDGQWLVYTSARGYLGMRMPSCELRKVRLDGSRDALIAGDAPCRLRGATFSPDGSRIALRSTLGSVLVADLGGNGAPRVVEFRSQGVSLLSWVHGDRLFGQGNGEFWVADADTGPFEVWTAPPEVGIDPPDEGRVFVRVATSSHVVLRARRTLNGESETRGDSWQSLVDLRTGEAEEFLGTCWRPAWGIWGARFVHGLVAGSPDRESLWYAPCSEVDGLVRQLWVRDLERGTDRLIADLDRYALSITPSPNGSRALVAVRPQDPGSLGSRWYLVVDMDGTTTRIDPRDLRGTLDSVDQAEAGDWLVRGWLDDETVLLWGESSLHPEVLATMNVFTREKQLLFESDCSGC